MKKKLLALLLLGCIACGSFAACGGSSDSDNTTSTPPTSENSQTSEGAGEGEGEGGGSAVEAIDYAASVTLDMNSTDTIKQEATVHLYIDGDTTHFNVPDEVSVKGNGILKARYLAVNTPESTGKIEEWGKTASNFTKSKLQAATSIVLETDKAAWEVDSTGERCLVWVWYKTAESDVYRNLNIELLQNGLAIASDAQGNRYGSVCGQAINQAMAQKLHVYSDEKDPNFYYGDAQPIDLKELRLNTKNYNGVKVAVEGIFTYNDGEAIYLENYDEEDQLWYGMYVYYGYNASATLLEILKPGNYVRVVGSVSEFQGSWQISGLEYNRRNPDHPNSSKLLGTGYTPANVETSIEKFRSNVSLEFIDPETEELSTQTYKYTELCLASSISMKSLKVKSTYTTQTGGDSDGAISITCEAPDGTKITVRTAVLLDDQQNVVTADVFKNKTIDVNGVIDVYNGEYQIRVLSYKHITIH
ncbi:MAG: thermonuclease family protein [Clostridia bacterium]|nr:thermonuclease family protein [Clostridia bacterium]